MNAPVPAGVATGDLTAWIAPGRTALVLIDIQVDFALPEGALGQAGVNMAAVAHVIAKAQALAQAARAAHAPVVFVGLATSPETDSEAWRERMRRRGGDPDVDSALCRLGEPGANFVGPTPLRGEAVVLKTRYSAFADTDMDGVLKGLGVDTLVLCGLTTECCVDCTARDAFQRDYHVFIPVDACAAYDERLHAAALDALALNCAILTDTPAVIAAWSGARAHG